LKTVGKFIKFFLIPGNILAVTLLWLSGLSVKIDPVNMVLPAFLGLAYPFILLLNVFFIIAWLFIDKKFALISVLAILIGFQSFSKFFQINITKDKEHSIKLMNYNVRLFDLYNWSKNKTTRNKIFDLLKKEDADIYCFQEFYQVDREGFFTTRDTMITFLRANNYREAYTHKLRGDQYFGVATFTSYPVVSSGIINFDNDINNVCLFTDLKINNDTVRVYNLHIASIRFSYADYKFVETTEVLENKKEIREGITIIYKRLAEAFTKRSSQTRKVLKHIETSPYPVIVSGDFNDTPISWCYDSFSDKLIDSFKEAGNGIGNTYIGSMPSYRIDFIFHDTNFEVSNYTTLPESYSDHHPVTVDINLLKDE